MTESGKKPIPGPAWLIIGVAMILMSVMIDSETLLIFILTGAIFVVFGFFKIVIKLEEKNKHKSAHLQNQGAHKEYAEHAKHRQQHKTEKKKDHQHIKHTQIIRCRNCGVKLHPQFRYCPNCGQSLK